MIRTLTRAGSLARGRRPSFDRAAPPEQAAPLVDALVDALRQRGCEVTVVDPMPLPNERIFGTEIGTFYRDVHRQHGVSTVSWP